MRRSCTMSLVACSAVLLAASSLAADSADLSPQNQTQQVLCPRIYMNGTKLTSTAQNIPARFNNRVSTYSCYWYPSPGATIHTGLGIGDQAFSNACPPGEVVNQVHLYRYKRDLDVWFGVQVECCQVEVQVPAVRVEYVWVPANQCP